MYGSEGLSENPNLPPTFQGDWDKFDGQRTRQKKPSDESLFDTI
jgi:hypothetical protein